MEQQSLYQYHTYTKIIWTQWNLITVYVLIEAPCASARAWVRIY